MMGLADAQRQRDQAYGDLDFNLEKQRQETQFGQQDAERGRVKGADKTNNSMAGRGMFHSSMRDAELFDIDATAGLRKQMLQQQLDTQTLNSQRQKSVLDSSWTQYMAGLTQKQVENAKAASEGMLPN